MKLYLIKIFVQYERLHVQVKHLSKEIYLSKETAEEFAPEKLKLALELPEAKMLGVAKAWTEVADFDLYDPQAEKNIEQFRETLYSNNLLGLSV